MFAVKKKIFLLFIVSLLFSVVMVSAEIMTVELPKNEYSVGETVLANIIINAEDQDIYGKLIVASSIRSEYFSSDIYEEQINLKINQTKKFTFPFYIAELVGGDKFQIQATLLNLQGNRISEKSAPFEVLDSKSILMLDIDICSDALCEKKSKVYTKSSKIYLDYKSDVNDPKLTANLKYPDNSIKQLKLPTSIVPSKIGTYELIVAASKEGHISITKNIQFGVIEKHTEIESTFICNVDNVCSDGENWENCPRDCELGEEKPVGGAVSTETTNSFFWFILGFSFLVVVIIIYVIYKKNYSY